MHNVLIIFKIIIIIIINSFINKLEKKIKQMKLAFRL
jgi:hypothetical protein